MISLVFLKVVLRDKWLLFLNLHWWHDRGWFSVVLSALKYPLCPQRVVLVNNNTFPFCIVVHTGRKEKASLKKTTQHVADSIYTCLAQVLLHTAPNKLLWREILRNFWAVAAIEWNSVCLHRWDCLNHGYVVSLASLPSLQHPFWKGPGLQQV